MIAVESGLRIDDVLSLPASAAEKQSFTVTEKKTGKRRHIRWHSDTRKFAQSYAQSHGKTFLFPHRTKADRHRTRQAVWKDLKRASSLFRFDFNFAPHSLRKYRAVEIYRRTGSLEKVKAEFLHEDIAVTVLYALADFLTEERKKKHR